MNDFLLALIAPAASEENAWGILNSIQLNIRETVLLIGYVRPNVYVYEKKMYRCLQSSSDNAGLMVHALRYKTVYFPSLSYANSSTSM